MQITTFIHDPLSLIIGIVTGGLVVYLLMKLSFQKSIRHHRRDAVSRSRSVIQGQVSEQLLPLHESFPYHPKDLVFIGKGFDYLVLDGLHAGKLREIIFVECKTGSSQLNHNEKMIKSCITSKQIYYEIIRI